MKDAPATDVVSGVRLQPGQVAQRSLLGRGNEAALQQSMAQQVSDPFRILDIGLSPTERLDVLGIHYQDLKFPFQYIEDGLPVHSGAFHCHMRHPAFCQPAHQLLQILTHCPECAYFLDGLSA